MDRHLCLLLGFVSLLGCDNHKEPSRTAVDSGIEPDVDTGVPMDSDGDGFMDSDDCAPDDPEIHPGAEERCNGLDDDCDGAPAADEADADGDGFAVCGETVTMATRR